MPSFADLLTVFTLFSSSSSPSVREEKYQQPNFIKKEKVSQLSSSASTSNNNHNDDDINVPTISIGRDVHGKSVDMPLIGAGTWQYNDTIAYESVCKAFQVGYTFVDTAWGYGNQKGVGRAIQDCWTKRRDELFVMTKIPGGLHTDQVLKYHEQNLQDLQLDYVDHVMTHFPSDWSATPTLATPKMRQEEWKALELIYYSGEARSIGISHYCPNHIHDVLQVATVTPSINQVEYHIGSGDVDHVIETCRQHNITFMSFSPLCGPCQYEPQDSLIHGDLVMDIASHYSNNDNVITGSQVSLRYIVQQALEQDNFIGGVIPKSNNIEHIRSNLNIFSFELNDDDMEKLKAATKPAGESGDCDVP